MDNIRDFLLCEQNAIHKMPSASGELMRIRVPFAVAGVKSESGRTYSLSVLKKACADFNAHCSTRTAYGKTSATEELGVDTVSHLIEQVFVRDGKAFAALRLLPTRRGVDLAKILSAGGALGAALRGTGRTENGIVTDLVLHGVDMTLAPSWPDAMVRVESFFESLDVGDAESEAALHTRYSTACRMANYKGTFEQYRRLMRSR